MISSLSLFEKLFVAVKNTVTMSGFKMQTFYFASAVAIFGGMGIGKFLFIIKLMETYQTIAGPELKYDIEVLIMDLKSGNFEERMTEFDKRLGNSYVSRLSKALIAVNRGDDQSSMLNYLLSDMGLLAKEMMQRELNKRPGRVKMLVIPIVIVAVAALFYVIGMNLFTSLGGIM